MKKFLFAAGIFALSAALVPSQASAQGRSGGHGGGASTSATVQGSANSGTDRGLYRADVAAGKHGARGRAKARTRGANAMGFCPPGQAKKSGQGSRFAC